MTQQGEFFKYFMLTRYGVQDAWGLRVHLPHGLNPHRVLSHKENREIIRTFIYEPLQSSNVQKKPMEFLGFQPRDTTNLKAWSTSANDMC